MILSAAVTIIVNGSIVASVAASRILGGRVVAPIAPVLTGFTSRVVYDPVRARVTIGSNGTQITVRVAYVEDGVPYVELGTVVTRLGGSAVFDSRTKTLVIDLRPNNEIATPDPFDPGRLQTQPNPVFTAAPVTATPRALESEVPRPRRTAIPAAPSQPQVSPPR